MKTGVTKEALPADSLLSSYACNGNYTDCYVTEVAGDISLARYLDAFYKGWLFRIERKLLAWFVDRPSTDTDVERLAEGSAEDFAAWSTEQRRDNEILLCDLRGKTRSWLKVDTHLRKTAPITTLYFGSAVVASGGQPEAAFRWLLGFHKLYSRALLAGARSKLR